MSPSRVAQTSDWPSTAALASATLHTATDTDVAKPGGLPAFPACALEIINWRADSFQRLARVMAEEEMVDKINLAVSTAETFSKLYYKKLDQERLWTRFITRMLTWPGTATPWMEWSYQHSKGFA